MQLVRQRVNCTLPESQIDMFFKCKSKEALTSMGTVSTSSSVPSVSYTKADGCFVSKKVALFLSVFFVSAVMSTALLVYYVAPHGELGDQDVRIVPAFNESNHFLGLYPKHFEAKNPEDAAGLGQISFKSEKSTKEGSVRLPTSVKPIKYLLHIQPFINGNFTILGNAEITIEVLEATSNITLHIADIITRNETITLHRTDNLTGPGVAITDHLYDHQRNFYIAILGEELTVGQQYLLYIEYEGYLNDQLAGLYRSQYTKEDGTQTWLAVTQFEPTDARRAFPCFDEPALKAEFDIYVARKTNMTAVSNMPLMETIPFEDDPTWVWDHFDNTLPMSTYLIAIIVSDFTFVNSTFNDHVLFRVWARNGAIEQAEYAIQAGPSILTWYEEYFSISFPLPKQDMAALPDFSAGAMENWGLITYRETALLYDPDLSSASNKERVAYVIAHELAHMWFGDLVTMKWWTDIWLNEGFATYVEYLGVDSFEPSWLFSEQFVPRDLQAVFALDCLETSHPINQPAETPDEINQLFDSISYSKGASIIRMMNHFLTESTFRTGLTSYLTTYQYSNADQDDLWQSLTEQAHVDGTLPEDLTVKTIMDTWTLQMGFPVVNVTINGNGTATLTQERFLLIKNPNSNDTHDYKWWIPITYTSQENPDFTQTKPKIWIPNTDSFIIINNVPTTGWVIFNIMETGYYRVNYEPSNWQFIVDQLLVDHTVIHHINRAQVLDDALVLAQAGQLSYDIALNVNSYLDEETEFVPWTSALNNLAYLESMFTRSAGYGPLRNYLLTLLTPLYDSVGFPDNPNDPHTEQKKRVLALNWACSLGLADCVTNSVTLFAQWMDEPTNHTIISPNLKPIVYCTAIGKGGAEEWEFAWNQYLASNLGSEKDRILSALGCSKEIWILSRYLEMAFTEGSGIRKQDSSRVFSSVSSNDAGRDLAWNYLRDNVEKIAQFYQGYPTIASFAETVSYEFNTPRELAELQQFKEDHLTELGSATYAIDQSIERTTNNIAWMDNYYDVIVTWLQENGYGNKLIR